MVISARLILTPGRLKSQQKYNSRTLFQGPIRKLKKVYNVNAGETHSGSWVGGFERDNDWRFYERLVADEEPAEMTECG